MYDMLLQGATLVDPVHSINARRDVAISGSEIAAVEESIDPGRARTTFDVSGKVVIPGIIDSHVHVCRPFGGTHGFRMMAKVGVTTAIDLAGYPDTILESMSDASGLSLGFVYPIIPEGTVPTRDPDAAELAELCDTALEQGAVGIKILGGHYPLTPEATARAIAVGAERGAHVAIHAGTTATGSNIEGVAEILELAAGHRIHLAHVNSYCRGQITGDPVEEAVIVLRALRGAREVVSESYLGLINGAVATCRDGAPTSNVVKTCIRTGGFEATRDGLEAAILAGWARINRVLDGETRLLAPDDGLAYFREMETTVGISFPVNSPGAAIALAVDRRDGFGSAFTIDAISTDGGAYPRNTIVAQGLALVRYGALSIEEFVVKTSVNPARMFGLPSKAHLGVGSDADVTVLDLTTGEPHLAIARGALVMQHGQVVGRGGCLVTRETAVPYVRTHAPELNVTLTSAA